MNRRWTAALLCAVVLSVGASPLLAREARYLPASALDLTALLPDPPALGSPAAEVDREAVRAAQNARTPASIQAARADALVSVYRFADVLGPAFNAQRLPKTTALFREAALDASAIGLRAKDHWARPRPYRTDNTITPLVSISIDGSYPSGHAAFGCMTAVLLGYLVPEKRPELLARGRLYGQRRITGGVHYPTDVEAGCLAGVVTAVKLLTIPAFQADFSAVRAEVRGILNLPDGDTP